MSQENRGWPRFHTPAPLRTLTEWLPPDMSWAKQQMARTEDKSRDAVHAFESIDTWQNEGGR